MNFDVTKILILLVSLSGGFVASATPSRPPPETFDVEGFTDVYAFDLGCFNGTADAKVNVVSSASTEATLKPDYNRAEALLLLGGAAVQPESDDQPVVTGSANLVTATIDKDVDCATYASAVVKGKGEHRAKRNGKTVDRVSEATLTK